MKMSKEESIKIQILKEYISEVLKENVTKIVAQAMVNPTAVINKLSNELKASDGDVETVADHVDASERTVYSLIDKFKTKLEPVKDEAQEISDKREKVAKDKKKKDKPE